MKRQLTDERYRFGSYRREDLAGTLLQRNLRDRGIYLSKSGDRAVFRDEVVAAAVERGVIAERDAEAYREAAVRLLLDEIDLSVGSNEELLRRFHALRLKRFGLSPFRALWRESVGKPRAVDGLDQAPLAAPALARSTHLFYCSESAFLPELLRDVGAALAAGKRAVCIAGDAEDGLLPGPEDLICRLPEGVPVLSVTDTLGCMDLSRAALPEEVAAAVDGGDAVLRGYGEDALLACHDLALPALVTVSPWGVPARAVTGLFTRRAVSRVFIPAHFSIYPTVPLTRRTELSFYQLSILADKYGEDVYFTSWQDLARRDGGVFLNVYDDHLPPRPVADFHFTGASFGADREAWCEKKLASLSGIRPLHACFSLPDYVRVPVDWEARDKREQILADGVLVAPGTPVRAIRPENAVTPRALFFDRRERGRAILSNFNFFFTFKLLSNYNDRLTGRPRERIDFSVGTLDYYRYTDEDGVRHESLPLYGKSVLAADKDGFYAFDYPLGGGTAALLPGLTVRWSSDQVNAPHPELTVYTPYLSVPDEEQDDKTYLRRVGEGRLNVAVIGEKILCARRGDVYLPCVGTVFSLSGALAERAEMSLGAPDKNGYFEVSTLPAPVFRPDPPPGISGEVWEKLDWAYGGGLGLIDERGEITPENYEARFRRAGWLAPLSRQTQESRVHTLVRHPRTAAGVTEKGAFFVLVISGRTPVSAGADYLELCRIARLLVPDLKTLINWDGGGSSVLGLLEDDVFTEINYPAPSGDSVTGMARPVRSILYIEAQGGIS